MPALTEANARQDATAEAPEQARAARRVTVDVDAGVLTGLGDRGVITVTSVLPLWTGERVDAAIPAVREATQKETSDRTDQ